ncbi:aminotransferase class IV [Cohaesibacter gelatinilyticus]|uniref:Probable branched-chain-amino-acid aminotransferase n=1 Tax=Cohaesibacter gelatinilyticus TaxID=372072 RepID=A0A285NGU1_9HYPH|nr:aminotransferase class IV [Cohaesibacter gelatinilyticus]SNZ08123.1 branched-chain amino acid aminotransferase [Cohaesibacter gelatinilyticus]
MSGALAISLNGELLTGEKINQAGLAIADRGALLGDGLFETLPIWNGQIIWINEHLDRLSQGLSLLGMDGPKANLRNTIKSLKPIAIEHGGNAIVRLTITRGEGGRGLLPPVTPSPTILASLSPYPQTMAFADVTLATSTIRRNEGSPLSRLKSLGYLDNILATKEASNKGAEDALIFNNQGHACCSTIANLFAVFDKTIVTPPLKDGVLGGIMREKLLDLLPTHGVQIEEKSQTAEQLKKADGLFLTNSLRIIRRVTRLDNQVFETSKNDVVAQCQAIMRAHLQEQFAITL